MLINGSERPRRKRLSWESRCEIVAKVVEQGMSPEQAAACSGVHRATVYRLLARYTEGGWGALKERPSTPARQPRRLARELEDEIVAVRRRTNAGPQVIGVIVGRADPRRPMGERRGSHVGLPLRRRLLRANTETVEVALHAWIRDDLGLGACSRCAV